MPDPQMPPDAADLLKRLARKYVWWNAVDGNAHPADRIVAQAMNLGTYADIEALERTLGPERLAAIMTKAEPGWFSPRSWEFWRGRLSASGCRIAEGPPQRAFDAAVP